MSLPPCAQAPILFFLRTPVGDVLSSFAKDQDTLDETLPDTIHMSTIYLMILLTSLAIVTVSIYYYAALTGALIASFLMMQFLYLPAATVLKRWAGETASQVRWRRRGCLGCFFPSDRPLVARKTLLAALAFAGRACAHAVCVCCARAPRAAPALRRCTCTWTSRCTAWR